MTICSIDQDLLEDLVDFKLRYLIIDIDEIIHEWGYRDAAKFLDDAKNGTLQEAEMDAISLRQLLADREKLEQLKEEWRAQ